MSVNKLVISTLSSIAPIAFHEYTGTETTYMTFFTYNERAGLIADDDEISTVFSIQLDIYSKGNVEELSEQVVQALKALGFRRTTGMQLYEKTTKTYRKMLSFSVYITKED